MATYLARLADLVNTDTGPDDQLGRDHAARRLAQWARDAGLDAHLIPGRAGEVLHARLAGALPARVVLLGHHDTVFSRGTAGERPLTVDGTTARGPGAADMKGGLLLALAALEALAACARAYPTVELHSVPDEETRTVPFDTMDRVLGADAVLVFECGRENGDFVAVRKTGAWVRLRVHGRPAHAGTEPERGRSAIVALCREVLRCSTLTARRAGLTVTAGTIAGGTMPNVVPAAAEAIFDVRAETTDDVQWAVEAIADCQGGEGLRIEVERVGDWPGIEPTPAGAQLAQAAVELGAALGVRLAGQTTGGRSDGCWTSDAGIPTIDGLGPVGGDDHSPAEYIDLSSVAPRCGIVAGLTVAIGAGLLSDSVEA